MTAPAGRRIVVVGDVALDIVVRLLEPAAVDSDAAARNVITGGGAGANVATWLAEAGAYPVLVARVGDDAAGRDLVDALAAAGVELAVTVDPDASTGTIVVVVTPDGARTMYPDRGANLALVPGDLPSPLGAPGDHLHVSGYALLHQGPRQAALAALREARRAGMTTSVDASSATPLQEVGAPAFTTWTDGVDVLRANLDEARVLVPGVADGASAAQALARRHAVAVVTAGAAGAWVARGSSVHHLPPEPGTVVDPVGAGDALTAGFLAHWTARRDPSLRAALRAGVALAAAAVSRPGARPGA